MSHPWSYYASSGYYQYPYYGAFGYNTQACGDNQSQQASDVSDATTQIPQPPGAQSDSTVSTAASTVSTVAPQYTYGVYGAYFPYNMAAYSSDLAMYAAQRWNAVNCSYYSHCSGTSAVAPTSNALNSPRTDSRFSGQNGAVNSAGSGTITGNNNASSDSNASKLFESGGGESKWSPELKDYVQRAFLSTETPIEKDQMERILRQKIEYVFRNSVSVDWNKEPIPTIPTKCLAAVTQSTAKKSSVNVVRPVPLQPWRTRGRNAGALPTGTLVRNQQTSVLSGKADVEKSNVVSSPLSSNNRATEPLPLPELAESTKRKRCFHQRSGSSRSSSTSSSYRDESRQKRISRKRSSRSPVRPSNKRRKYHRESGTDSDHLTNDRTNSEGSDNSPISVSPKLRRGRNKKRVGSGRKKPSPKKTSPSPSAVHGGKRGGANVSRGRGGKTAAQQKRWVAPDTSHHRLSQRADRFKDHLGAGSIAKSTRQLSLLASVTDSDLLSEKLEQFNIVGTMQELEKPYLRLTAAPDPANVRPPDVLKKAVAHVKQRWKERGDYLWVCEQFKSIRQDLTVQRIQTELTAEVYEAHADIALEAGDLQEFHQCQSQLSLLHAEGLGSSRRTEFTAYRLLYYIFTQDLLAMSTLLASLKDSQKANPFIQFALKVREAWALRNYKRFFHLACDSDAVAPFETETSKMRGCRQILSWSLDRERKFALKAIFKTYRPYLSFDFVTKTLGFDDASSCAGFITQELGVAAATLESVEKVDCKAIWSQMRQSGAVDAVDH